MRLVTVTEVKNRMVVDPSMLGVNPAIESALTAAHLRMETEYDTRFEVQSNSDTFMLDPLMHNGVRPGGMYRLQLRNAFVRQAPLEVANPMSVSWGYPTPNQPLVGEFKVDAMRGLLYVPESYGNSMITVTYDSGFADNEKQYAPDWLKEAILAYVPVVFNFSNTNQTDTKSEKMNRQSGDHAIAVMGPYKRNIGFCIRPVY